MATAAAARPRSLRAGTRRDLRRWAVDRLALLLVVAATLVGICLFGLILLYVVVRGAPALSLAFFTERPLPFGEVGGGVFPAIMGTLTMLAIASAIALPLGLGTAI